MLDVTVFYSDPIDVSVSWSSSLSASTYVLSLYDSAGTTLIASLSPTTGTSQDHVFGGYLMNGTSYKLLCVAMNECGSIEWDGIFVDFSVDP